MALVLVKPALEQPKKLMTSDWATAMSPEMRAKLGLKDEPPPPPPPPSPPLEEVGQLTFLLVPPADLARWWPQVRAGIEEVIAKTQPTFIQEQIFNVLQNQRAWLNLTFMEKEIVGVTVVGRDGDQFAGTTDAIVLIAWTPASNRKRGIDRTVRVYTQARIEDQCRQIGIRVLRMHSPRPGMLKMAEELGYEPQEVVYRKVLNA